MHKSIFRRVRSLSTGGTGIVNPTNNALLRVNAAGDALEAIPAESAANNLLQYRNSLWSAQPSVAGKINQVITSAHGTILRYNASGNYLTGMTITITPTSVNSRILLIADICAGGYGGNSYAGFVWVRRGTGPLIAFGFPMGYAGGNSATTNVAPGTARGITLDNAGVITPITYEIQADIEYYSTGEYLINWNGTSGPSTLMAMEVLP